MKILITGSKGFVGSELYKILSRNHDVLPLTRKNFSLTDSEAVDKFFNLFEFDVVIHCAIKGGRRIRTDDKDVLYDNLLMFENLAKHQDKFKLMISFGSGAELDRRFDISEECNLGDHIPVDNYGLSKYIIAQRIEQSKNLLNLRIFNCFGLSETEDRFIKTNLRNYKDKKSMVVFEDRLMDFFSIEDLASVVEYCINNFNNLKFKSLDLCYKEKRTMIEICNFFNTLSEHKVDVDGKIPLEYKNYIGKGSLLESLNIKLIGFEDSIRNIYNKL